MAGNKKQEWLRLATIGPHFLVSTLIGIFVGKKLDQVTEMYPVWTVVFAGFGIAAGFVNLFRELAIVNRSEKEAEEEKDDDDQQT